jgi:hypothetical protein
VIFRFSPGTLRFRYSRELRLGIAQIYISKFILLFFIVTLYPNCLISSFSYFYFRYFSQAFFSFFYSISPLFSQFIFPFIFHFQAPFPLSSLPLLSSPFSTSFLSLSIPLFLSLFSSFLLFLSVHLISRLSLRFSLHSLLLPSFSPLFSS